MLGALNSVNCNVHVLALIAVDHLLGHDGLVNGVLTFVLLVIFTAYLGYTLVLDVDQVLGVVTSCLNHATHVVCVQLQQRPVD